MAKAIKWKVPPAPTGRYKSFQYRGWPTAYTNDAAESPVASIRCEDDYSPRRVKSGEHSPLKVVLAIANTEEGGASFKWRTLKGEFKTLAEAKKAAEDFYAAKKELFYAS